MEEGGEFWEELEKPERRCRREEEEGEDIGER
jgi:hypothetical protein